MLAMAGLSSSYFQIDQMVDCFLTRNSLLGVVCFLILAAAGKSAQLGLHAWLPNAMEAPTPVRALIHAATLVTAGVYLLVSFAPVIVAQPIRRQIVRTLGMQTSIFAGFVAISQPDIKRVIAFSTCSQVRFMIAAAGLFIPQTGVFLLVTHAIYKALLFLAAGGVIHALQGKQDIRVMGGLAPFRIFLNCCFLVASLALCAAPYIRGDFRKDAIIEGMKSIDLCFDNSL